MSMGHMSPVMGHTLVKPLAQFMAVLCMGQLQSHAHSPLPSGQSHLHEHFMPSPIGGVGPDPDPPVGGFGPDPVGGLGPDPDPVGGLGPDPDPGGRIVTGCSPDPNPSVVVSSSSAEHFEILAFPFLTERVKEKIPNSTVPEPEHFLSQPPLPLHILPLDSRLRVQVHFAFPSVSFSRLNSS